MSRLPEIIIYFSIQGAQSVLTDHFWVYIAFTRGKIQMLTAWLLKAEWILWSLEDSLSSSFLTCQIIHFKKIPKTTKTPTLKPKYKPLFRGKKPQAQEWCSLIYGVMILICAVSLHRIACSSPALRSFARLDFYSGKNMQKQEEKKTL